VTAPVSVTAIYNAGNVICMVQASELLGLGVHTLYLAMVMLDCLLDGGCSEAQELPGQSPAHGCIGDWSS